MKQWDKRPRGFTTKNLIVDGFYTIEYQKANGQSDSNQIFALKMICFFSKLALPRGQNASARSFTHTCTIDRQVRIFIYMSNDTSF